MAPPAGQIRPGRYLAFFVAIVAVLYGLVFLTGDGKPTPKLGIDLQGGTRVTLTARTDSGGTPNKEELNQAKSIIETRVNGMGVTNAEVVLDGTQIVITVAGQDGELVKGLGQTARLSFRGVDDAAPAGIASPPPGQNPPGQNPPTTNPPPGQNPTVAPPPGGQQPGAPPAPQGRPAPAAEQQPPPPSSIDPERQKLIDEARATRQSKDPAKLQAAFDALTCDSKQRDPLIGNDLLDHPLVTCGDKPEKGADGVERMYKYKLSAEFIPGSEIDDASAASNTQGAGYVVNLKFKSRGTDIWSKYTAENVGKQTAVTLDTKVLSAPSIKGPIPGGNTEISGDFTQKEAQSLANALKYGALPLAFDVSDAVTVSATLGLASLEAGLIAGAIGLALVFVYALFYYRALGVLTILSLALSGLVVYAFLVLLGRWIGFTLDLAGIAGFIIAIGITADSFIIYFERLKDEIREGRTFRSAVPRGWIRARRTILSADAVSFLASAVLYVLAVGQVRGFAFTLGMSTVLDLIVVFLVTHPLLALAANSKTLSNPKYSGLGQVQKVGAAARAARSVRGDAAVKEA
ncbi:preprotein translocase subunit SecD [Herbihabitans rhizosphaerae]|uniref:Protein translocase subunit SecD n=1 Tax=Herbihabitans rhizosphaerae TaxID=1872711 RepID=A0A4Q7KJC8_9PSEU|nr:protein translocase subunit SecD [Herbihabitans rhizosphaerae]RZS34345.1 preprotein translocase subunit SecD [Herbihabitans rhizosphaerae]